MDFESDFRKKNEAISLSSAERQKSAVLILDAESNIRLALRQSLIGLGYGTVSDAADQSQALQKIEERHFTHLLFDARQNRPAAKEFLHRVFEMDEELIVIATSYEPTVDDVFDLLICGCRGYLMKPFTTQSLDDALVLSTKGERISEAI
ncbi:MAG: response regulator, partial [Bdellovibrionales bacterium]|nr:response regulator [Bdellovibrionales bacterium]